jgi:putative DNA primase/helicase
MKRTGLSKYKESFSLTLLTSRCDYTIIRTIDKYEILLVSFDDMKYRHKILQLIKEIEVGEFIINRHGVFYRDVRDEVEERILVCSPLLVTGITRNKDGNDWGKLLVFADPEGHEKQYHMSSSKGQNVVISDLVHRGLVLSSNSRSRHLLAQYLRSAPSPRMMLSSSMPGWVKHSFVLPYRSFGPDEVVYSGDGNTGFGVQGNWKNNVGKLCSGNSRLIFAASVAFAAPLMRVMNIEGGGFHFRGDSSKGKTTALQVAASVCGKVATSPGEDSYLLNWKSTANSFEEVAQSHNDCLMVIDELGQADAKTVGDICYMLANGQGKARMGHAKRSWRVMFITSGEISLAEQMARAGEKVMIGQEIRLLEISTDCSAEQGLFEDVHRSKTPAEFSNRIKRATANHYGTPLQKFLEHLTSNTEAVETRCRSYMDVFLKSVLPPNATGVVPRAALRFALVAAAGELATRLKLTGWRKGEAFRAAKKCFGSWMEHHRTFDPVAMAVDRVQRFIMENNAKFEIVGGNVRLNGSKVGYQKKDRFLILPNVFRDSVCAGADPEAVANALEHAGYLNTSGPNRKKKQERIQGQLGYFYSVPGSILKAE